MKKLIYIAAIILVPSLVSAQIKNVGNTNFAGTDTSAKAINNNVLIYPNPTTGPVRIVFSKNNTNATGSSMVILDKSGKPVYTQNHVNNTQVDLDLGFLQPGVYAVLFGTGINQFTQKILIAK